MHPSIGASTLDQTKTIGARMTISLHIGMMMTVMKVDLNEWYAPLYCFQELD
jgi:hypothetical protein